MFSINGDVAQLGRASDLQSEGPEFDSLFLHEGTAVKV